MSYENRKEQNDRDGEFVQLKHRGVRADVLAMRQALIDGVKAKLGIT